MFALALLPLLPLISAGRTFIGCSNSVGGGNFESPNAYSAAECAVSQAPSPWSKHWDESLIVFSRNVMTLVQQHTDRTLSYTPTSPHSMNHRALARHPVQLLSTSKLLHMQAMSVAVISISQYIKFTPPSPSTSVIKAPRPDLPPASTPSKIASTPANHQRPFLSRLRPRPVNSYVTVKTRPIPLMLAPLPPHTTVSPTVYCKLPRVSPGGGR